MSIASFVGISSVLRKVCCIPATVLWTDTGGFVLCLKNASCIELYLTSQTPGFGEYEEPHLPGEQVAQGLWQKYQSVPGWCPYVPDVHLIVVE